MTDTTGKLILLACSALFVAGASSRASRAQTAAPAECAGPVYHAKEVTRRAVMTERPAPGFTEEARANHVEGTIKIGGVLCRDGRVTDVVVLEGLPHGMNERAAEAARRIKFRPAKRDGRAVSQWLSVEYGFNVSGGGDDCRNSPARCAGELVEKVAVQGNRRLSAREILSRVRTRPGDRYDSAQAQRDLQAVIELPILDPKATHVTTTAGARGVVVTFTVMERPVVRDITFEGLEGVGQNEVWAALRGRLRGFVKESSYDPATAEAAARVVSELLAARGLTNASVEVVVENVSSDAVALTFVVRERR